MLRPYRWIRRLASSLFRTGEPVAKAQIATTAATGSRVDELLKQPANRDALAMLMAEERAQIENEMDRRATGRRRRIKRD